MRLPGWLIVSLALAFPARASTQTVKQADLVGAWRGRIDYVEKPNANETGMSWLTLWPDSTWWLDAYSHWSTGPNRGGGQWRVVGDTLWLGFDARYWLALQERMRAARKEGTRGSTDTTYWKKLLPASDSLFWSTKAKSNHRRHLTVYKLSLAGQQLSLVRLDGLSDTLQTLTAVRAMYERYNPPSPN